MKVKLNFLWALALLLFGQIGIAQSQTKTVGGTVTDGTNPLPGVTITVRGTTVGTITDFDGNYTISAEEGAVIEFSFVGYATVSRTVGAGNTINVVMVEDAQSLGEVVLLGSRAKPRTSTDSPVPVDVFNISETSLVMPQTNINQLLNAIAPSFQSTVQTAVDGTDHLDPAQLRGMGPDQVLVLLNGKRRHTTALVNVNGSTGRGSVGTDLNAIPSFALDRIEVLRDGASAQYGSDAISGVMNVNLRKDIGFSGQINFGGNLTSQANDGTENWDGTAMQADLNYGARLGNQGGFINFTLSAQHRKPTSRAGVRTGQIYNAYNAIEQRAREDGMDLNAAYTNINLLQGAQAADFVGQIQHYAQGIDYLGGELQNNIQTASSIADLQAILGADVTEGELAYRGLERRYFNMRVGQSEVTNTQFFVNTEIPVSEDWKIYAFGGYGFRDGESGGFFRLPIASNAYTSVYPDGYLPKIKTHIQDFSLAAGIEGTLGEWHMDLSNTFGQNRFDYIVTNSHNVSLRSNSPTRFEAGGPQFMENTINLDLNRDFDVFENLNLAFGAEHRYENFKLRAGEPASFLSYDNARNPITSDIPDLDKPTDFFGALLPGGSQVYGGFREENAVDKSRNSFAVYTDAAIDFTDAFLVDAAVRYEHYSDFGNTVNFKLASRVKLSDDFNWRIAGSTGFRAPSIHQIYFNQSSTYFVDGGIMQVGTFSNDSEVARLLGIPQLKEEKSLSFSTGFTYKVPEANLTFTLDGYFIKVKDRIQLTGRFEPSGSDNPTEAEQKLNDAFEAAGVEGAQFFANAIDTETKGVDFVVSHKYRSISGQFSLTNDFALNLNQTKRVGDIHSSDLLHDAGLDEVYFNESSRIYLEEILPRVKASLSHVARLNKFDFYLRNTYFGKTTDTNIIPDSNDEHQVESAKIITDLSVAYNFTDNIALSVGANNLFDIYPDKNLASLTSGDQFVYMRAPAQFGLNGRYVFAKLNFKF